MIISTISLNPAIDKTYMVDSFAANSVNRAKKIKTNIGGKGINVAAMSKICGFNAIAAGFVSGINGCFIENELVKIGVETDFVHTDGETRVNIKIADEKNQTFTDINDIGPFITLRDVEEIYKKTDEVSKKSDYIHIGGSIPPGADSDIYKKLVEIANYNGAVTMLDAEGEVFKNGIEAKPRIIKPNRYELELLIGKKLNTIDDVCAATTEILNRGIDTVLVSLGEVGAVAANKSGIYRAFPLNVPVKSTVCAGDSFLMGYVYGCAHNESFTESLKYAISFASAKIQKEGTDLPSLSEFKAGFDKVIIEKIC